MSEHTAPLPQKIRVTGLQEAQLVPLQTIEQQCADMFHQVGLSAEQHAARSEVEIARLTQHHDVMVAEADDEPAGLLAWADEPPGVAHLVALLVTPARQRCGIATRLLRELGESASTHGLPWVVTACWDVAPWALSFLAVRGFQPFEPAAPERLLRWQKSRGDEVAQAGQRLWWAKSDGLGTIPGLPRP